MRALWPASSGEGLAAPTAPPGGARGVTEAAFLGLPPPFSGRQTAANLPNMRRRILGPLLYIPPTASRTLFVGPLFARMVSFLFILSRRRLLPMVVPVVVLKRRPLARCSFSPLCTRRPLERNTEEASSPRRPGLDCARRDVRVICYGAPFPLRLLPVVLVNQERCPWWKPGRLPAAPSRVERAAVFQVQFKVFRRFSLVEVRLDRKCLRTHKEAAIILMGR